jgi:peptidoglycan hydrolase-like protein with peptidoglycan-binding domain
MSALVLTVVAVALSVGGLVAVAKIGRPVPSEIEPPRAPVYAEVILETSDHNQSAVLELSVAAGQTARSQGSLGMVTAVKLQAGDRVENGTVVYWAAEVPVVAYVSPRPLHRPLDRGATGGDVKQLQELLAQRLEANGTAIDGVFGLETRDLVREYQRKYGLEATGIADPAWFIRIDAPFTVAAVAPLVGLPAPGLGEPVVTSEEAITTVSLEPEWGVEPGHFIFIDSGARIPIEFDGTAWTSPSENALLALAAAKTEGDQSNGLTPPDDPDQPDLPQSSASTGASRTVTVEGRLALAEPVLAQVLPASAIIPSVTGAACVWTKSAMPAGAPERVAGLNVLGSTASGAAMIDGTGLVGRNVLLEPAAHLSDATCP